MDSGTSKKALEVFPCSLSSYSKSMMLNFINVLFFQDLVGNEFEKNLLSDIIEPNNIGVTFDNIGALENVKEALEELVIVPLKRPELYSKGQLLKVH
jgi:SpoVK/Ycf46/Vps4 family AAA+-type ATPase